MNPEMTDAETRNALLEVGCAEIPAAYIPPALEQMESLACELMDSLRMPYQEVATRATPRRLVLEIRGVPSRGEDTVEEARGPSLKVAFDEDGNPTAAAEGFARGQGISVEDLEKREEDRGTYVYAVHRRPGRSAVDALSEMMVEVLQRLKFPRTMRWGCGEFAFARPVQWLVALWGDEVIPLEFAGVRAGRTSQGPRFSPADIQVTDADGHSRALEDAGIIIDGQERRRMIAEKCVEAAASVGGQAVMEDGLLGEITYLVEHPEVVVGSIPSEYLEVPRPVLVTAMQAHLRFLPVEDEDGQLMPHFLSVINGTRVMKPKVLEGNELVLNSRLADARFFWDEDRKLPLEAYGEKLAEVVLHEELGSLGDKVNRLTELLRHLGCAGLLDGREEEAVERAVRLCKADLVTLMVQEFPSLQGRMGEQYARVSGEDDEVCRAIGGHYLPASPTDPLPPTNPGRWLSLMDRVDHLVGAFYVSLGATGSEDPYGLRRSANGVLRLAARLPRIRLRELLTWSARTYCMPDADETRVVSDIAGFFQQRLLRMLMDSGYAREVAEGVLERGIDDVWDVWLRAEAVSSFLETETAEDLLIAWRRCHNLSREFQGKACFDPQEISSPEVRRLHDEFTARKEEGDELLAGRAYLEFMSCLSELRPAVDDMLDSVTVMVSDEVVRERRLGLLRQVAEYLSRPMDWSRLPGRWWE